MDSLTRTSERRRDPQADWRSHLSAVIWGHWRNAVGFDLLAVDEPTLQAEDLLKMFDEKLKKRTCDTKLY
jgi:hypothetical protein